MRICREFIYACSYKNSYKNISHMVSCVTLKYVSD